MLLVLYNTRTIIYPQIFYSCAAQGLDITLEMPQDPILRLNSAAQTGFPWEGEFPFVHYTGSPAHLTHKGANKYGKYINQRLALLSWCGNTENVCYPG